MLDSRCAPIKVLLQGDDVCVDLDLNAAGEPA